MRLLGDAPGPLLLLALIGFGLGVPIFFWLARRAGRRVLGRPLVPISSSRTLLTMFLCLATLGAGCMAAGFLVALRDYRIFTAKAHVAEIQCIELEPTHLRLYYVPIEPDGTRGATESYDLDGDEWSVGGNVLRFRPFVTRLGVTTAHRVTRVEGRWLKAADAGAHKPTAFDRAGGTTAAWLVLFRDGATGPLGFLIAGAHGQAVSQLPDRRALFNLYVTPNGYVLEKRAT